MPNYVYNRVRTNRSIKNLDIFTDGNFDFNKLIPMPEELKKTEASTDTTNGLLLLWQTTKEKIKFGINPTQNTFRLKLIKDAYDSTSTRKSYDIETEWKECSEYFSKLPKDRKEEMYQEGIRSLKNFEKSGYCNWYYWARDNWNTKWNAMETKIVDDKTIRFTTAWSMPANIIAALSKSMQGDKIEVIWADECDDGNVGKVFFKNGLRIEGGFLELGTKEWIEVSNEIFGCYLDEAE